MAAGLSDLESLVRTVPFFHDLDRVEVARLIGAFEEVRVPAGAVVFAEDGEADALYLLQRGRVRVEVRTAKGDRRLAIVEAPGYFGELGLLLARRTSTVRTETDVVLQRLPRARFEELARERPRLGLVVAATLAQLTERRQRRLVGAPEPSGRRPPLLEPAAPPRPAPRRALALGASIALAALLWLLPAPAGLDAGGWHVVAVLAGGALAWLLDPVPDFVVALAIAAGWGALGLAPLASVFSGFATSSWVTALGALAVAAVMTRSGLVFRTALALLRVFPRTHRGQVAALLTGGVLTTPLVPLSVARVGAIAPLSVELAQALGYEPRSRASAGLAFAGFAGYWYFSSIFLTGFATNFFLLGILPAAERTRFDWLGWLGAAALVGAVCFGGAFAAIAWLFPPEATRARGDEVIERQRRALGPIAPAERLALASLAVLLAGLIFQPVLKVDAAWPALVALIVAMAGGALDRERFRSAIDWGFLMLFGALLGYGEVLHATGVDAWLAGALLPLAAPLPAAALVVVLAAGTVASRFILPSRPAIFLLSLALVPLAPSLGIAGWVVGFVILVCANVWIYPYQGLEYLIARDATRGRAFSDEQGIRIGAALTAVRLVAVAVSVPYWIALGLVR